MDKLRSYGAGYVAMWDTLREIARDLGYTLAIHGSLIRDFDVVAVPWIDDACEAERLVEIIRQAVAVTWSTGVVGPTVKPHGRRAWSILLGGGPYIDLSVMPRMMDRRAAKASANRRRRSTVKAKRKA